MGRAVRPGRQWGLLCNKEGLGLTADEKSQDGKCGSSSHLVYVDLGIGEAMNE